MQELLYGAISSKTYTPASFVKITKGMDRIINAPYIKELQKAIEETSALITHFQSVSGKQLGEVDRLEKLTINTIESNKTPKEMVHELKAAFASLVNLMEEDAKILDDLSKTDQLTNLGNRRAFDDYLQDFCEPARAEGLFLLMIDIDHFKMFNDNYGHLVGDEVLSLVGAIIKKATSGGNVRGSDTNFATRYGGEEFAIIMPFYNDESSMKLAEFIRSRIQRYPVVIRNSRGDIIKRDVHITASIGIAEMHPAWLKTSHSSSELLIKAADKALYAAKKRGRNMICQHKAYKGSNGKLTSVIL